MGQGPTLLLFKRMLLVTYAPVTYAPSDLCPHDLMTSPLKVSIASQQHHMAVQFFSTWVFRGMSKFQILTLTSVIKDKRARDKESGLCAEGTSGRRVIFNDIGT